MSAAAAADVAIGASLSDLDQGGRILAEYVWLGPDCTDIRCKTRVLEAMPAGPSDLLEWNYDGSSTEQAPGQDSEVLIVPRAIFRDPFRRGSNIMVLCDTYVPADRSPLDTNSRHECALAMEMARDHHPWFGIEQEYTLFQGGKPLGWPVAAARSFGGPTTQLGFPGPQGPYYCSAGADVAFGRAVADAHLKACLFAGVKVSGINAEVMPGQWEFQVGPCEGIQSGDHMVMARYLLTRVGELFNVVVSFDPKPVPGDWNGAGCHTNYSTQKMRDAGGYDAILGAIKKLELRHMDHMERYGEGNERRLTGKHETAPFDQFSWGVANRGASIRVGNQTAQEKRGYLEDRRPSSNMDPYVVTMLLVQTTILDT